MKKSIVLICMILAMSLSAQDFSGEYELKESKRIGGGAIGMLVGGLLMIGGGAAALQSEGTAAKVMGGALITAGLGLDIGSIFLFKKSRQFREDARKAGPVPLSLLVSPRGVQFIAAF